MEFTIKRGEWYRGFGATESALLRPDGQKCCLGFFAKACGYQDEDILSRPYLYFHEKYALPFNIFAFKGYQTLIKLVEVNDNESIKDSERENKIIKLFSNVDIKVIFED